MAATFEDAFTEWRGNGSPDVPRELHDVIDWAMSGHLVLTDNVIGRIGYAVRTFQGWDREVAQALRQRVIAAVPVADVSRLFDVPADMIEGNL